ncbi:hypothetical protein BDV96DRAFT_606295 [Lophiotrema nucula]|uniref:RRM domain-containing protein n=1 Tax=Lophiotrema nucula TaxID=690887 RepID=A0A6A5YN29_9PLEO|nr:hypothetical protein BDV96DRAFT_606295 [Lophiotrema nucula]
MERAASVCAGCLSLSRLFGCIHPTPRRAEDSQPASQPASQPDTELVLTSPDYTACDAPASPTSVQHSAAMNTIRSIQKLNQRELEDGTDPKSSWHTDYRDTAFIYVGGLPFDLSEGDIITIFSQFGEPTWIKLARDRETGKSRGFCWIKYEDQRSTDLAVDNLGGATVMSRTLRVDHARYKPKDDEDMRDNTMGEPDPDEDAWTKKRRKTESESESEEERPMLPEETELAKLMEMDDDDPMKASMVQRKQEEVDTALRKLKKAKRKEKKHHSRRHVRDGSKERERRRIKYDEDDEPSRHKRSSRRDRSPEDSDASRERRRRDKRRDEDGHLKSKRSPRRDRDDQDQAASKERYLHYRKTTRTKGQQ